MLNAILKINYCKFRIIFFSLITIFLFQSSLVFAEPKNDKAKLVQDLNTSILQLRAQIPGASITEKNNINKNVLLLLQQRFTSLKELMKTDPKDAQTLSFPADVLAQLTTSFPEAKKYLETRGEFQGELQTYYIDHVGAEPELVQFLKTNGEKLYFFPADTKIQNAESGLKLKVKGIRAGSILLASGEEGAITSQTTPQVCSPTGNQNVVTVLVNLKDYTLPAFMTPDYIQQVLFGNPPDNPISVPNYNFNEYWQENSVNQTQVDANNNKILGPYPLNFNYNGDTPSQASCDYLALENDVISLIDPIVDLTQYTRLVVVFPNNRVGSVGCNFSGLSTVGCINQTATTNGNFSASNSLLVAESMNSRSKGVFLYAHELGHALGIRHARMRDCHMNDTNYEPLGPLGSVCNIYEYSDYFSTMGNSGYLGFYSAKHTADLGWMQEGLNYGVIETSGTYTIQNYEGGNVLKALKIRRGTGNDAWLWLEARRGVGIYDAFELPEVFNGALIHYQDSYTGTSTDLVDFTQETDSWEDVNLDVGQSWNDPYSNLSISILSETPNSLTISVNYLGSESPCVPINPGISMNPASVSMLPGSSTVFDVDVTNLNPSSCPTYEYDVITLHPGGGFTSSWDTSTFWLKPGETKRVHMTFNAPSTVTPGTYSVASKVFDRADPYTALVAIDRSTVYVTGSNPPPPPPPPTTYTLSVSKSGNGSVTITPPGITCANNCTQQYNPNVSVGLTAVPGPAQMVTWSGACTGTGTSCSVIMNSNKNVTATFSKKKGR